MNTNDHLLSLIQSYLLLFPLKIQSTFTYKSNLPRSTYFNLSDITKRIERWIHLLKLDETFYFKNKPIIKSILESLENRDIDPDLDQLIKSKLIKPIEYLDLDSTLQIILTLDNEQDILNLCKTNKYFKNACYEFKNIIAKHILKLNNVDVTKFPKDYSFVTLYKNYRTNISLINEAIIPLYYIHIYNTINNVNYITDLNVDLSQARMVYEQIVRNANFVFINTANVENHYSEIIVQTRGNSTKYGMFTQIMLKRFLNLKHRTIINNFDKIRSILNRWIWNPPVTLAELRDVNVNCLHFIHILYNTLDDLNRAHMTSILNELKTNYPDLHLNELMCTLFDYELMYGFGEDAIYNFPQINITDVR